MRLFAAVEIDDDARRSAVDASSAIRAILGPHPEVRWVPAENLHLTVRFIGHVDEDGVGPLVEKLTEPLSIAAFQVALGSCGAFPRGGNPRVIWIGLRSGLAELASMHDEFNQRLLPFGFEPELRPFSAHLTLARVKETSRGFGSKIRTSLQRIDVPRAAFSVSRATIFASRPSRGGSRYDALAFAPLSTPPSPHA